MTNLIDLSQQQAELEATQLLEGSEKLLWAGKEGRSRTLVSAVVIVVVPVIVIAWQLLAHSYVSPRGAILYLGIFFAMSYLIYRQGKDVVVALTNERIMLIYPKRAVHYFPITEVSSIKTTGSAGTGNLKFEFGKRVASQTKVLSTRSSSSLMSQLVEKRESGKTYRNIPVVDVTFHKINDPESVKRLALATIQKQSATAQ